MQSNATDIVISRLILALALPIQRALSSCRLCYLTCKSNTVHVTFHRHRVHLASVALLGETARQEPAQQGHAPPAPNGMGAGWKGLQGCRRMLKRLVAHTVVWRNSECSEILIHKVVRTYNDAMAFNLMCYGMHWDETMVCGSHVTYGVECYDMASVT